ncbi:hypothetical protein ACU8KH_01043 [Lachancea thermotolerans]
MECRGDSKLKTSLGLHVHPDNQIVFWTAPSSDDTALKLKRTPTRSLARCT